MSIGELARLGQVSVRMLRHYDRIGLLTPARVDEGTGYRSYAPEQLARLNRVVALKELGFTLDEVRRIVDDDPGIERLQGMLQLRRSQLAAEVAASADRLAHVERRLRLIEQEEHMSETEYVVKSLPAVRLAAARVRVADMEAIGGVVEPLFVDTAAAVQAAGGSLATPVAVYDVDEDGVRITAGYDYAGAPAPGFELVELPGVATAMCGVHLGTMDTIAASWQALHRTIESQQLVPAGPARELYVRAEPVDDQSGWVTELQQPVRSP